MSSQLLARVAWLLAPLVAVAIASASEWPARAQMLSSPVREVAWPIANTWASIAARPAPAPLAASAPVVPAPVVATVSTSTPAPRPATSTVVASTPVAVVPVAPLTQGTALLLGDSLMGEVARGLRQGLPRTITLVDKHRASTGLTNSGYYQWPQEAGAFAAASSPQWVVIHLGANDAQDMVVAGRWLKFGSDPWKAQYLARAQDMIDQVRRSAPNAKIVWLGLPAMRSPAFNTKMETIATLHKQAAQSRQVPYFDGRHALGEVYAKAGDAGDGKQRVWRSDDGIHYSREGGYRLAAEVGKQTIMGWAWALK